MDERKRRVVITAAVAAFLEADQAAMRLPVPRCASWAMAGRLEAMERRQRTQQRPNCPGGSRTAPTIADIQ